MAEGQSAHEQAGNNLVADAEEDASVEDVVRQGNCRGHGDDIAAEQRQLHTQLALSNTVAHGGGAASDLSGGTDGPGGRANPLWGLLIRLVG